MPSASQPSAFSSGRWWSRAPDGRLECRLCPRRCKLSEGQRGYCGVRENSSNTVVSAVYGRSAGFCIDPIEKKPLNHFLPGSSVLSFGTAGCNLGCVFCQNWHLSRSAASQAMTDSAAPGEIADAAAALGCSSVAFTYNDPVVFAEYAVDTARACRYRGIKTVAVTAGYLTDEARPEFFEAMDAANVDLKGFSDDFYRRLCHARLQPVLDTLVFLHNQTRVWLEVTTLLIPGENDSDSEIDRASDWFAGHLGPDVPWHFSGFHPDYQRLQTPPTPAATLERAQRIARAKGLRYVYTGNVHTPAGEDTLCPACGAVLVARRHFAIEAYRLRNGCCQVCGCEIPGVFPDSPGTWGPRCQPVRLSR